METVSKLVRILKQDITGGSNRQSLQVNVYSYTARVTMDITGDGELPFIYRSPSSSSLRIAVFEHQFGALDGTEDRLRTAISNLE